MTKFDIDQKSNHSIFEQVVSAAIKMILSGELKKDEAFPSIRKLAADLKIHPNTAHKVVQHLIKEQWLISVPGKGTIVASILKPSKKTRRELLSKEISQLISEAQRLGVSKNDVVDEIEVNWINIDELKVVSGDN